MYYTKFTCKWGGGGGGGWGGGGIPRTSIEFQKNTMGRSIIVCASTDSGSNSQNMECFFALFIPFFALTPCDAL